MNVAKVEMSLIVKLCEEKDWENALKLLKVNPAKVRECNDDGEYLINLSFGNKEVALVILELYPEVVFSRNREGELPLHVACR